MLCEIVILALFCHTYIFLQLVCIILCEIFIQTLVYPTLFAPQWLTNRITTWAAFFFNWFVSSVVRFLFKHCFTPPFLPHSDWQTGLLLELLVATKICTCMLAIWSLLDQMLFSTGFSTGLCRLRFLRNASPNYARPVCGVKYVNYLNRMYTGPSLEPKTKHADVILKRSLIPYNQIGGL